jgi:hypothetical protein
VIPQTQRWWRGPFLDADGEQTDEGGDCFAACLASIMELSIYDLPNFLAGDGNPEEGGWWRRWQRWLYVRCRCELLWWEDDRPAPTDLAWWIAGVMSGETRHSVVFYRDEFRWDPAPEGKKREWTLDDVTDAVALYAIGSIFNRTDGPPTFEQTAAT